MLEIEPINILDCINHDNSVNFQETGTDVESLWENVL